MNVRYSRRALSQLASVHEYLRGAQSRGRRQRDGKHPKYHRAIEGDAAARKGDRRGRCSRHHRTRVPVSRLLQRPRPRGICGPHSARPAELTRDFEHLAHFVESWSVRKKVRFRSASAVQRVGHGENAPISCCGPVTLARNRGASTGGRDCRTHRTSEAADLLDLHLIRDALVKR